MEDLELSCAVQWSINEAIQEAKMFSLRSAQTIVWLNPRMHVCVISNSLLWSMKTLASSICCEVIMASTHSILSTVFLGPPSNCDIMAVIAKN